MLAFLQRRERRGEGTARGAERERRHTSRCGGAGNRHVLCTRRWWACWSSGSLTRLWSHLENGGATTPHGSEVASSHGGGTRERKHEAARVQAVNLLGPRHPHVL